jgi:hypothetical protein
VSISPSTPPGAVGSNSVTVNIVPDNSVNYNYFFKVGDIIVSNFVTVNSPAISTVTVSTGPPPTLDYTVTGGTLSPTITYARKDKNGAAPSSAPLANAGYGVWLTLDTIVSITPSTPPGAVGSNSVTVNIVPDNATDFNYFFKVNNTVGTGLITVNRTTIPATPSVQARIIGDTNGATVTTNRNGSSSSATLPLIAPANTSLVATPGGSINVLRFTSGNNPNGSNIPGNAMQKSITNTQRASVTIALVFRLNANYNNGFQSIFASGKTWQTGTVHIFINSGGFRIGMSGASWGSEQGDKNVDNWNPGSKPGGTPVTLGTNNPYMVILTMDTSTRNAKLRINGITYENTFSASLNNIFGLPRTSGTTAENAAEPIINIGDWVTNTDGHRYLEGNVAEVILYDNKALTNAEIGTLENYVRTRYSGNSAHFGTNITSVTITGTSTTSIDYTIMGTSAGVNVYYSQVATSATAHNNTWVLLTPTSSIVTLGTTSTDTRTTFTITPHASNNYKYFFKVEAATGIEAITTDAQAVIVNKNSSQSGIGSFTYQGLVGSVVSTTPSVTGGTTARVYIEWTSGINYIAFYPSTGTITPRNSSNRLTPNNFTGKWLYFRNYTRTTGLLAKVIQEFSGSALGNYLKVEFIKRIRDEQKFTNLDELKIALANDKMACENI